MKKLLSLLLVALMLVGLMAGCGTTETTTSNPPADDGGEVSAPPADDTAPDVELTATQQIMACLLYTSEFFPVVEHAETRRLDYHGVEDLREGVLVIAALDDDDFLYRYHALAPAAILMSSSLRRSAPSMPVLFMA